LIDFFDSFLFEDVVNLFSFFAYSYPRESNGFSIYHRIDVMTIEEYIVVFMRFGIYKNLRLSFHLHFFKRSLYFLIIIILSVADLTASHLTIVKVLFLLILFVLFFFKIIFLYLH